MTNFKEALDFCNLKRISYLGYKYIWDNRRKSVANTKLVLNRVYLNSLGFSKFYNAKVKHILNSIFDHLCLLMAFNGFAESSRVNNKGKFYFEIAWTREEDCKKVISNSWVAVEDCDTLRSVQRALTSCALALN